MPDLEPFDTIQRRIITSEHERCGIGTLGERTLHVILKHFYEPDTALHEQKVGRYVADIRRDGEIVEIQTRGFRALRAKLTAFTPEYRVKVVYPIAAVKHLTWLNPETGELSNRRKSPKRGSVYDFLYELYALRPILPLDGVSFDLVFLDMDEFKTLTGWGKDKKHGAPRYERIPTALREIVTLETPADFMRLVPESLPETFTTAEFSKAAKLSYTVAGYGVRTLVTLGVIEPTDKRKNAIIYKRKDLNQ
ncbi:MAG: hypothetical protein IJ493_00935 [Clostridia bacterium]|nr:hypothetical protein [Clostridia bacterium]